MNETPGRKLLFLSLLPDLSWAPRPMAEFARLGCECAVLSSPGSASSATHFVAAHCHLPHLRHLPLRLLAARFRVEQVCRDWRPDLIVPLDDFAGWLLRGLATDHSVGTEFRCLLEYSLGSTSGYDAVCSRTNFLELATKIGIRVPASCAVDRTTAVTAAEAIGFPVMIKLNQTDAGQGVAIAQDPAQLLASIDALGVGRGRLLRRTKTAAGRFFWKRAGAWITPGRIFELQQFIPGVPAMHIIAAWQGRLLAGVSFVKAAGTPRPFGPSTVVRCIEHTEMNATVTKLVTALKPPHRAERKGIMRLTSFKQALENYQIIIDHNLVSRVFAETFKSFPDASARCLRDKIIFEDRLEWRLETEAFSRREIDSEDDVLDFFVGHFVDIDLTRQPSS